MTHDNCVTGGFGTPMCMIVFPIHSNASGPRLSIVVCSTHKGVPVLASVTNAVGLTLLSSGRLQRKTFKAALQGDSFAI